MSAMTGRAVLVTGGIGGIGLAPAAALAGLGARVGIVGPDPTRAEAATTRLRSDGAEVNVFVADVSPSPRCAD
jgi:retinol dehydrogenase 14